MAPLAVVTLAAVALLLVAERRQSRSGVWIWKTVASTGFVAAAIAAGAEATAYGRLVLAALALCWLGDVLLIPKNPQIFRAGIVSFLLGHVAFLVAFLVRGVSPLGCGVALALLSLPSVLALRWLSPHLSREMKLPVTAYVGILSLMVVAAVGTAARAPGWSILIAAVAFFASDLSVARDRFVHPSFVNRAWGLPLYYAAQLLFAATTTPG